MVENENGVKGKEKVIYRLPPSELSVVSALPFLTHIMAIKNMGYEMGQM